MNNYMETDDQMETINRQDMIAKKFSVKRMHFSVSTAFYEELKKRKVLKNLDDTIVTLLAEFYNIEG